MIDRLETENKHMQRIRYGKSTESKFTRDKRIADQTKAIQDEQIRQFIRSNSLKVTKVRETMNAGKASKLPEYSDRLKAIKTQKVF